MNWFSKRLEKVEWILNIMSAALVMILMFLVVMDMVGRSVYSPLPGLFESSKLVMVGIAYLGLASTQRLGQHIGVDLVVIHFTPRLRQWLKVLVLTIMLGISLATTYWSGVEAYQGSLRRDYWSGIVNVPTWPAMWLVPIGCGFLLLRIVYQLHVSLHSTGEST